jgi:hypothetical protein
MDLLVLIIPFCLAFEFFYLVRTGWKLPLSKKGTLVVGLSGLVAVVVFVRLVGYYDRLNPRGNGVYLPTVGLQLKGWAIAATLLVGFLENLVLTVIAIVRLSSGASVPSLLSVQSGGRAQTNRELRATRAAAALGLEPRQSKALVYIYEHKSMTIDDFARLCPEADRPSLEQDLQALVRLGIMVPKGDKFIIT